MEDYEIRQTMNRQLKPIYEIELHSQIWGREHDELWVTGAVQNVGAIISHDVSSVLMLPVELSRRPSGPKRELIEGIEYAVTLDEFRNRMRSELAHLSK